MFGNVPFVRGRMTSLLAFGLCLLQLSSSFTVHCGYTRSSSARYSSMDDDAPSDVEMPEASPRSSAGSGESKTSTVVEMCDANIPPEVTESKSKLLQLCASYDRGYGATPNARAQVQALVDKLTEYNPTDFAAQGINGDILLTGAKGSGPSDPPLKGIWRMVWTTALDVLNLGANPISTPAAIYQQIEPPVATNIIDFIPRAQSLLPSQLLPSSILRAEVKTRACERKNMPNRVGLVFESVKLVPLELLGVSMSNFPPLGFDLPKLPSAFGVGDGTDGPGYFDVLYLDDDLLIIKQNEPGGIFVSIKVDDCDP